MNAKLLRTSELTKALRQLENWSVNPKGTVITHTRQFKNHIDALVFIARVTVHAQVADHHPDITFTYKKVKIALSTHDVKGITRKDIALAKKINSITAVDK